MRTPKKRRIIRADSKETEALLIKVSYIAHPNGKKIQVPLQNFWSVACEPKCYRSYWGGAIFIYLC